MKTNKEKNVQDFFKQEKIKMELQASQKKAKVTKFLKVGATAILSVSILIGLGIVGYDALLEFTAALFVELLVFN